MMKQAQRKISTKIGMLYLVASEDGLQGIYWHQQEIPMEINTKNALLNQVELQLDEYLNGKRNEFDIPLDIQGTEFQKQVWKQLTKIPYGKLVPIRILQKL